MEKSRRFIRFVAVFIACTTGKLLLDFISLIMKTGIVAIWQVVNNLNAASISIKNYAATIRIDPAHALLEGLIIALIVWFSMGCNMSTKHYSFSKKIAIVFVSALAFEMICFMSSLVQFILNGIWSAVTSSAPSVTLRNNIAVTRWANIDYLLRLCEGMSMLKILQFLQVRIRRKARRERG